MILILDIDIDVAKTLSCIWDIKLQKMYHGPWTARSIWMICSFAA